MTDAVRRIVDPIEKPEPWGQCPTEGCEEPTYANRKEDGIRLICKDHPEVDKGIGDNHLLCPACLDRDVITEMRVEQKYRYFLKCKNGHTSWLD